MTEELDFMSHGSTDEAPQAAVLEPSAVAAGAALRQAREAKGVHLVSLAATLKVPTKSLEYLEAGAFEQLPDLVFAKALASSVCRQIGADPAQVMQLWPATGNPTLAKADPANPIKPTVFDPYPGRSTPLRRLLVVVALLLVTAVLVWLWMAPQAETEAGAGHTEPNQEPVLAPSAETSQATGAVPAQPVLDAQAPSAAASTEPLPEAGDSLNSAVATVAAVTTVSAVEAKPVEQPASTQSTAQETTRTEAPRHAVAEPPSLALYFSQKSWVQIQSANKGIVVERMAQAGDVVRWPLSDKPLSVVLGYAPAVRAEVAGQARDLSSDTQRDVARFTVE